MPASGQSENVPTGCGHLHLVLNVKNKYALENSKASEQSLRDVPAEEACCGGSFGTCKSKPKVNSHLRAGDNYHSRCYWSEHIICAGLSN